MTHARQTALTLALLTALGAVHARASEVESTIHFGLGMLGSGRADNTRFGQYSGVRLGDRPVGLLSLDYQRRDDEAGTSMWLRGSDLLGETRELALGWSKQGDWKLRARYGETVRHDPNSVNTLLTGAGSTSPQVVAGAAGGGSELHLKQQRSGFRLGLWKALGPALSLELDLKTEDKVGTRLFGVGMNCPSLLLPTCRGATGISTGSALVMLPEPIHANHSQVEARLSYAGEQLRVSAGYYGSFFNNRYEALTPQIPGSLNNPVGSLLPLSPGLLTALSQPIALAPDNQAHQLDITGVYTLTPIALLNFKLGMGQALQHQNFAASGLSGAPAGVADLGGRLDSTQAQLGFSLRPAPKLALQAEWRYEDRDDKTPIQLYNVEDKSFYTNRSLPSTKSRGKLQLSYRFSNHLRGTLVGQFESIDRGVFTASSAISGVSALRQRTDETVYKAELRHSVSEVFSGSLGFERSQRDGSNWLKDNSGLGVSEVSDLANPANGFATAIFMPTLADRQRDKLKLRAELQPSEALTLQFSAEGGRDRYTSPSSYGLQRTEMDMVALDADYALSDNWHLNAYLSQGIQTLHQARPAGYLLSFRNKNIGVGAGFSGKLSAKFSVGGNLGYVDDVNVYTQALDAMAGADSAALLAATGGLPDVVYRQTSLRLFGRYEIDAKSALRLDLVHERSRLSDWSWGYQGLPFAYSDGSTVWQQPNQRATLVAITYSYKWR